MQRLKKFKNLVFNRHLLLTNTSICLFGSLVSDVVCQRLEYASAVRRLHLAGDGVSNGINNKVLSSSSSSVAAFQLNRYRTWITSVMAAALAPASHYWYIYLDRSMVGTSTRIVLRKVWLDLIIFSPFYVVVFTAGVSLANRFRRSISKPAENLDSSAEFSTGVNAVAALWLSDVFMWTPAQLVNFYFLPTHLRIAFDTTVALFNDIVQLYLCSRTGLVETNKPVVYASLQTNCSGDSSRCDTVHHPHRDSSNAQYHAYTIKSGKGKKWQQVDDADG